MTIGLFQSAVLVTRRATIGVYAVQEPVDMYQMLLPKKPGDGLLKNGCCKCYYTSLPDMRDPNISFRQPGTTDSSKEETGSVHPSEGCCCCCNGCDLEIKMSDEDDDEVTSSDNESKELNICLHVLERDHNKEDGKDENGKRVHKYSSSSSSMV